MSYLPGPISMSSRHVQTADQCATPRVPGILSLITFATNSFVATARALCTNALSVGFDKARLYGPEDLDGTRFRDENSAVLDQPRGAGYWLWKPYLIKKALETAAPSEVVFYCDAGRNSYYQFTRRPTQLEKAVRRNTHGFLLGASAPQLGTIQNWTKRDCLLLMDADTEELLRRPMIMTWSLWTNSPQARSFLDRWLGYCRDPRCLTDMPNTLGESNYSEFRDHRHDQSIATILAYKMGAPYLDFSRTLVEKFIELRPNSGLSHFFYKRPENADRLLQGDNPLILVTEYLRLRRSYV